MGIDDAVTLIISSYRDRKRHSPTLLLLESIRSEPCSQYSCQVYLISTQGQLAYVYTMINVKSREEDP